MASQELAAVQVMNCLLDRNHLVSGKPAPYKDAGVGYEIVSTATGQGLLSTVQWSYHQRKERCILSEKCRRFERLDMISIQI